MRTQGEARFTGQWQAKVGAASMVQDAIAKEEAVHEYKHVPIFPDLVDRSQYKPKYTLTVSLVVGSVVLVCMGAGIYLAVAYGL